jgi:hypothetical protein
MRAQEAEARAAQAGPYQEMHAREAELHRKAAETHSRAAELQAEHQREAIEKQG